MINSLTEAVIDVNFRPHRCQTVDTKFEVQALNKRLFRKFFPPFPLSLTPLPSSNRPLTSSYYPPLPPLIFKVVVEDAEEYPILVRGEVQHPKVCLLSCEASITNSFVGVPAKTEITLMNMTMLPTRFRWGELEGNREL